MSQSTITTYYNSRKRPADDLPTSKRKVQHLDAVNDDDLKSDAETTVAEKCNTAIETGVQKQELPLDTKAEQTSTHSPQIEKCKCSQISNSDASVSKQNASNGSKSEVVSKNPKELSLGDIRKKLAKSSRLAELKASAERLSRSIQQLKEHKQQNEKETKDVNLERPCSLSQKCLIQNKFLLPTKETGLSNIQQRPRISPRKVVVSPTKTGNKVPAYIRHASLATNVARLPLPRHYRPLAEQFQNMETVVSSLYNKNEKITFSKLKSSIQDMFKCNFTEKHLSQIKHLVPDFYNFEVQKINNSSDSSRKEAFEIVISPNFPSVLKVMNPIVLLERRRFFSDTLMQEVKKQHSQFMLNLDLPMMIPDHKLTRWHPEFEIEKVPEIVCAKLPELPKVEKFSTAQDVLARARELFKFNTKTERTLEKLTQAKVRGPFKQEKEVTTINDESKVVQDVNTPANSPSSSGTTILNPALRNLPTALLEKVKAKQAAKAQATTRS